MFCRIIVQQQDFNAEQALQWLSNDAQGAIISFIGTVRQQPEQNLHALLLEHYPRMTEKALNTIVQEAAQQWSVLGVVIIHRVGELKLGDKIVLVAVSSAHRAEAFLACDFIMDQLKTRAPFWKKLITRTIPADNNAAMVEEQQWVAAKASDRIAADRW